jgi:rRNA maturation RNase YbeY
VEEIQFLVAHGVLHLLGWQDTSPEQREAMLARQEELVRQWRGEGHS